MILIDLLWQAYKLKTEIQTPQPGYLSFGNTKEMADELSNLVLSGEKIATSSLVERYIQKQIKKTEVGDFYILKNDSDVSVAVVEVYQVEERQFRAIDEQFAKEEGDGTLANWLDIHSVYYTNQLAKINQRLKKETQLECIWFHVVYTDNETREGTKNGTNV